MRTCLLAFLLCAAMTASATTLTYQVNFTSDTVTNCFIICPASPLPAGGHDSWSASFQLDSSDLATDGSYDVTSSFTSARIFFPPGPLLDLTTSGTVDALVSGGVVTDLVTTNFQASYEEQIPQYMVLINFKSGGGYFRLDQNVTLIHTDISAEDGYNTANSIAYRIAAVTPEPASCMLLLVGAASCLLRRKR